jgi:hypothetical protein
MNRPCRAGLPDLRVMPASGQNRIRPSDGPMMFDNLSFSRCVRSRCCQPRSSGRKQAFAGNAQALVQASDHGQAQAALAVQHLRYSSARPDVGFQIAWCQPLLRCRPACARSGFCCPARARSARQPASRRRRSKVSLRRGRTDVQCGRDWTTSRDSPVTWTIMSTG